MFSKDSMVLFLVCVWGGAHGVVVKMRPGDTVVTSLLQSEVQTQLCTKW